MEGKKWDMKDAMYADFLIVATEAKEANWITKSLEASSGNFKLKTINGTEMTAKGFRFEENGNMFKVVLVSGSDQMGTESSGILTSGALFTFRPRAAIMAGMCASLKETNQVGDVALILKAIALDEGTRESSGAFKREIRYAEACRTAYDVAAHVITEVQNLKNLKKEKAHVEKVEGLTGSAVMKQQPASEHISKRVAVYDKEASAFMSAISNFNSLVDKQCECVCLGVYKGICGGVEPKNQASTSMEIERNAELATRNATECVMKAFGNFSDRLITAKYLQSDLVRSYFRCRGAYTRMQERYHSWIDILDVLFKTGNEIYSPGDDNIVLVRRDVDHSEKEKMLTRALENAGINVDVGDFIYPLVSDHDMAFRFVDTNEFEKWARKEKLNFKSEGVRTLQSDVGPTLIKAEKNGSEQPKSETVVDSSATTSSKSKRIRETEDTTKKMKNSSKVDMASARAKQKKQKS
jgi:nucleoside phosphorylase